MLLPGPDTRVVELRVHGMLGTRPESLVNAVAAVDVAGDGIGRIVRPADRLRRPAPGPVLEAEGRPLPRTVEGYVWGGMTSGGFAKAMWAVLFPFSMANVAHWMLPPVRDRAGAVLGRLCRALLRLASVLLTMLLVAQVAVVTLDLLAAQCLAPGTQCLSPVPSWLRSAYGVRPVIGLVPVLLVCAVLHRVSKVKWEVGQAPEHDPTPPNVDAPLPGSNLVADPDTPALRALHLVAALATVALMPLGGPLDPPRGWPLAVWLLAVVLLVVAVAGVVALDDPAVGSGTRLRRLFGHRPRWALVWSAAGLVLVAGFTRGQLPTALPGTDGWVEGIALVLFAVVVVFGVLLIPAALLARPTWRNEPPELRPWAGGWMAAPVLATAGLLGGGFGAGFGITVRKLLGGGALPLGYQSITLLWGCGAVLALVIGVPYAAVGLARGWRGGPDEAPVVALLHKDKPSDIPVATRLWRRANWQQFAVHRALLGLAAVLCAGAVVALVMRLRGVAPPAWTSPLSAIGVLALGLLAASLLRAVYTAARKPETARHLGVLADIACFWPREAHPTVPPCYALKVVPELVARTLEHLQTPGTRVVLTGHSQGALLVAVAAARLSHCLPPEEFERVGLVTAGAPLQWAYPRAFPVVVPAASLVRLHDALGGRWRSLCRGTDPLGCAVTTWRRQVADGQLLGVGLRPGLPPGPLAPAARTESGALVLGSDHWLPDPRLRPTRGLRWVAGPQTHQHYVTDPEWDRAVALAAGLLPSAPFGWRA
ncbi:hypothetical protein [Labedaea rhizosphaerae]|uniref:Lipase (Class 3) n=1 Tax=Labedaea rhizosphaerae TaxID=598644 RepID=A0A4R6S343_LABRH|nr:hypothetical protein [Labedaea rhizosphaerae]TDP93723.1 hypothetical protein EV186_106117 [Labedaea rhizosphaerae]